MSALRRLFRGENDYDFTRVWRFGLMLSALLLLISLASLAFRGLELGLDFRGGTSWDVPGADVTVAETRDALRPLGEDGARIQVVGGDTLRVQSSTTDPAAVDEVRATLAELGGTSRDQVAQTTVGPTWGREISQQALRALVFFFVAIALYITVALRDWRMAVGAVVATAHDVIISVGVYSIFQLQVTPATVIAFLTMLGFSLYDTVVVYSRLRDNTPMVSIAGRTTYTQMASRSLNQVLMRTLNTTITAVIPVLSILVIGSLVYGATTLQEFSVALLVGLIVGAYSSIFVATPIVAFLNERSAQYRSVRERLAGRDGERRRADGRAARPAPGTPAAAAAGAGSGGDGEPEPVGASRRPPAGARNLPAGYSASHPPRPRKRKR